MRRIFTPNRVLDMFGLGKDGFKNSNKGAGVPATELDADLFNEWQEELAAIVEHGGGTLEPGTRNQIITKILALIAATGGITPTEADARYIQRQYFLARDEKPAGTFGGSSTTGINQRTLNTVIRNTIPGAGLAANVITLPAGVYRVHASAPLSVGDEHQLYLYNTTDNVVAIAGTSEQTSTTGGADVIQTRSFINGILTLTATKAFVLRHRAGAGSSLNGLGWAANTPGVNEVYAEIEIIREGGV